MASSNGMERRDFLKGLLVGAASLTAMTVLPQLAGCGGGGGGPGVPKTDGARRHLQGAGPARPCPGRARPDPHRPAHGRAPAGAGCQPARDHRGAHSHRPPVLADRCPPLFGRHALHRGRPRAGSVDRGPLHTFPNVILWMAGHRHLNVVTPQPSPDPAHPELGFWEVETPSLRDFPQQLRTFEICRNNDHTVSIIV